MVKYRIVVGENGNNQGHIKSSNAKSEHGANIALGKALTEYNGDGWGYIEVNYSDDYSKNSDQWRRIY